MVGDIIMGAVVVLLVVAIVRLQRPLPPWLQRWIRRLKASPRMSPGEELWSAHKAEQRLLDTLQDIQERRDQS